MKNKKWNITKGQDFFTSHCRAHTLKWQATCIEIVTTFIYSYGYYKQHIIYVERSLKYLP